MEAAAGFYAAKCKPGIDFAAAVVLCMVMAPVALLLAAAVRWRMGKPVLFRQTRIGLGDRPFEFLKFRTMTNERDGERNLLPDARRLTAFGRFLRSSSLDELPQLLNLLRGDMSLVGPRPLLPQYLPRYSEFQRRRHNVRPGITGLAQVSGRNLLGWDRKFELDVYYVDHISAALDLTILMKTICSVLSRRGISQAGEATATEFMGPEHHAE
jgi:lipopolysaccharide/colanic/teichoic acid biosynthesis glycosyltransferase